MIVMVEEGRLGNQVFQYLALRAVARSGETLRLLGFDQLRATFDGLDARFTAIDGGPLRHLRSIDYARVRRASRALPGLGLVEEDVDARPVATPGRLRISVPAWFQSSAALSSPALAAMRVKAALRDRARALVGGRADCAFVHVRAGDYRTWPSIDAPAILSPQWYRARLEELRGDGPLHALVVGDEPAYVDEVADALTDASVVRVDALTEFALLTLCSAGVLSASTFAYWGAYFAQRDLGGRFLAPLHWAGHGSGAWYPPGIAAPFLQYRPVAGG